MREFVSALQMQNIDQRTMNLNRLDSFGLMQKVTDSMLEFFQAELDLSGDILFLCGPGNNGADGYLLAEKLRKTRAQFRESLQKPDRKVWVYEVLKPKSIDCIKAAKFCKAERVSDLNLILKKAGSNFMIVDAVFGYQARADLPAAVAKILKEVNAAKAFRVALDMPSGIEAEGGKCHRDSFLADVSLCVGFPKLSFLNEEVAEFLGRVEFIGDFFLSPRDAAKKKFFAIERKDFIFSKRARVSHKSQFGKCGIVGGSAQTPGAAFLSAEAAHRVGAGYVNLFLARAQKFELSLKTSSFLFKKNWAAKDLNSMSSLVLGCGGFPEKFDFKNIKVPSVLDADALQDLKQIQKISSDVLLTPHPGEAARLLKSTNQKILKDRVGALDELVKKSLQSVYLKGAPGILKLSPKISSGDIYYVNLSINPVFAKAGSGDILSGIAGGFLAQKPMQFKDAILSGLIFQQNLGEVLRDQRATIASDQLHSFSKTFERLK
ncbi:MAG: NAD(P)H-hydrate epimerase [Deltaproteobacteria bacterium]|nr:NAD(P)H-hydrate epimerase [Deltaproteobacteria bacterium]